METVPTLKESEEADEKEKKYEAEEKDKNADASMHGESAVADKREEPDDSDADGLATGSSPYS